MKEIQILIKWLEIKKLYSSDFPDSLDSLKLSVHKSSLLKRMLDGKDPLPLPPPLYYSHPWYSLIENGFAKVCANEFFFPEGWQENFCDYPCIMIAQFPWEIIRRVENKREYLITYHYKHNRRDVPSNDLWSFAKIQNGENPELEIWEIKRVADSGYIKEDT